jgi:hypothetical protein
MSASHRLGNALFSGAGGCAGQRVNTIRVMVKPLGNEGLHACLRRVERDRPDSAWP